MDPLPSLQSRSQSNYPARMGKLEYGKAQPGNVPVHRPALEQGGSALSWVTQNSLSVS